MIGEKCAVAAADRYSFYHRSSREFAERRIAAMTRSRSATSAAASTASSAGTSPTRSRPSPSARAGRPELERPLVEGQQSGL